MNTEQSNQSNQMGSVYFEMHRLSWGEDGGRLALFLAGTEASITRRAAARLASTIASETGVTVADDVVISTNVDLDELPF